MSDKWNAAVARVNAARGLPLSERIDAARDLVEALYVECPTTVATEWPNVCTRLLTATSALGEALWCAESAEWAEAPDRQREADADAARKERQCANDD